MSNYRTGIRVTIAVAAAILLGAALGVMLERKATRTEFGRIEQGDKLSWALSLIGKRYVDPISRDSLAEVVIPSLLEKLDPHSVYIPAQDFAATNEPLTGSFDGIGVTFNMLTDTVLVNGVISGGPSDKAGLVAGDRIMTVNDTLIAGVKKDQDSIVMMLRGPRGSTVKLGVLRSPGKEITPFTVTRGIIPIKSLDAAFLIKPDIGYIRFSRFASTTYIEVLQAMNQLRNEGATKMILDVRDNSGGYLDQAIYIANEFLPQGQKIVYTEGHASPRVDQLANGKGSFQDIDLAIVISESSASAAEILAGAIQDNDRGLIIGRRSFGKGLVQEQYPYRDGSAIRLTMARYYTPVGRSIQKPYTPGKGDDYEGELRRRYDHNEMLTADSIRQVDSLRFVTPGGNVVYGGGGIMPDVFVPMDTTSITPYFMKLFQKNLIFRYASQYTEQHRSEINAIKSFEQLDEFLNRRNLFYDFVSYAERQGVHPTQTEMTLSRQLITSQLKGYIGRNTELVESAYYYYMYPQDPTLLRTVEELNGKAVTEQGIEIETLEKPAMPAPATE